MADTTLNRRIAALAKKLGVSPESIITELRNFHKTIARDVAPQIGDSDLGSIDKYDAFTPAFEVAEKKGPEWSRLYRSYYDKEEEAGAYDALVNNYLQNYPYDLSKDGMLGYTQKPDGSFVHENQESETILEDFEKETGEPASPERPKPKTLDQPEGAAVQVKEGPNLENPAGLAAMGDNLGRGVRDPKDKIIPANQRRNMEKALNAQAARKIDEDIAKQRRADRTQKIFDDRDADLKEAWAQSRTGRRTGLTFDELDAETQADMRNRYNDSREAGAYSDEKYEAYKKSLGVPVYDENGLVGYESSKKFEEDMGDQQFRENPNQPNSIQKRERKDKATLDGIRDEIRETGKHPFGEGPILGTDHAREVELSKKYGGDMAGLKKAARDVRDSPVAKANYAEAFLPADFNAPKAGAAQQGPSRPLNEGFTAGGVVDKFKSSTANLMNQESEATNSVLDNVPMPQMPRPTFPKPKPGPFHYTNKTKNYPVIENYPSDNGSGGLELTRTSPEVAVMPPVKYPSSNQPGMELTRTSPERLTMDEPTAQYRKQTPGYGRSGKKQYNIPGLDRLDPDNYDYRPNAPKHPGGAGMGRSGKKQYNIPALEFLDPDNYFYNQ